VAVGGLVLNALLNLNLTLAGARQAAKGLGIDMAWKGPLREDDRAQQIQIVEQFVSKSGIGLAGRHRLKAPGRQGDGANPGSLKITPSTCLAFARFLIGTHGRPLVQEYRLRLNGHRADFVIDLSAGTCEHTI
jgi:hypothetical protein